MKLWRLQISWDTCSECGKRTLHISWLRSHEELTNEMIEFFNLHKMEIAKAIFGPLAKYESWAKIKEKLESGDSECKIQQTNGMIKK
jgi:hypothetical protein